MQVIAIPKQYSSGDYERLTVLTSATKTLTASKVKTAAGKGAKVVLITVESNDIRWRDDGGDPSTGGSGNGSILVDGQSMLVQGYKSISDLLMIAKTGTAYVHVHYYY